WLALAIAAEIVSFVAAAELQHLLLGPSTRVDRLSLVALTYAGTAMSATLPAGPAVSGRYTYRTLVRRGSSAGAAAWVLAATAILSFVTLVLLGLVGAQIRGFGVACSAVGAGLAVAVSLLAAGLVGALVWSSRHRERIESMATSVAARLDAARRLVGHRCCRAHPAGITHQAEPIKYSDGPGAPREPQAPGDALGAARLCAALALAGANWLADLAALAVAFAALGFSVPWHGLLLAYAVTQLVTIVPLLPGSIGVAEGSMAAALVCSGVHPTEAVAGVLAYRLVSFWLVLPVGWLAWTFLRRRGSGFEEVTTGSLPGRVLTSA
ncbi:MAG TPA: flippase-like domain-containing protein, partial [Acidimicrobiales bacterium]|nr:flippase-like domain-containing protein [Acidimicrobiales bacterium]